MNALVKKEIRLLLPSFLIGQVPTLEIFFLPDNTNGFLASAFIFTFLLGPAVAVFMSLNSFGVEICSGTFSMLLAQPVSRSRIWRTKTLLLAAALFAMCSCWFVSVYLHVFAFKNPKNLGDFQDLFVGVGMFLLVVYSGALWTVMLLRQVAAAFWFTLLVPGAIWVVIAGLLGEKHPELFEPVTLVALAIYSVAGFIFARWLFLRAQDVAWTGGTIALPEMRGLKWWGERPRGPQATFETGSRGRSPHRLWRPKAALFWKELQLHQAQFIMAGALTLLHFGVIATRKFGHYQRNSAMEFVLEIFWGLWLVMPMLVGAAAVAEERKLGILGSQFCLPVKRRTQFAVKFRVAMLLSILFGVVMPLLLEGSRILPGVFIENNPVIHLMGNQAVGLQVTLGWQLQTSTAQIFFWYCFAQIDPLLPLLALMGAAVIIGAVSFYASTLARNTLQALAPSVLGLALAFFLIVVNIAQENFGIHLPWRGWLVYFIGFPVFAIALVAMAFWNFQRIALGWNVWRRNAIVFAAALAFVVAATTAIYHRAWEKLTPFEPAHGAARLSLSNPATLREQWNTLFVRLPDGRIWTDDYAYYADAPNPLALILGDIKLPSLGGGHFYGGSNWVNVIRSFWDVRAGIKTDGTLWVSEKSPHREQMPNGRWKMAKSGDLVQFGSETNWRSVVPINFAMQLVKNDGTLWRWGLTNWDYKRTEWPDLRTFTPQRLGTESNWSEVFLSNNESFLRKTDGSVWRTWINQSSNLQTNEIEPGFSLQRAPDFENGKWRGTTRMESGPRYQLCVLDDGTFRIRADEKLNKQFNYYELTAVNLQFGKETNWLGVAGRGQKIVTLKDDGSLWLWNFYHDNHHGSYPERDEREMLDVKPVRLGTHADWIAIATAEGGIISLAADGSLWFWPLEEASNYYGAYNNNNSGNSNFEPLLDVSRKPQFLGNVFGKTE